MFRDSGPYECWSVPLNHAAASRLYSLPPQGIGTAFVESLIGYIARLAEAHSVHTGTLVVRELLPRTRRTRGPSAGVLREKQRWTFLGYHILNGLGEAPREWCTALEDLTGCARLDLLTVLWWKGLLSCIGLLRTSLAWCPHCFEAQRASGMPVYEPLLWALRSVSVCPRHQQPLDQLCPHCGRGQYTFSANSRPGYCSRCRTWLGKRFDPPDPLLTEQVWTAEAVGEILAASPRAPDAAIARRNLRTCVDRCAGGNWRLLKKVTGWEIRRWMIDQTPSMDSLLRFCKSQRLSPVRLLADPIPADDAMWDFAAELIRERGAEFQPVKCPRPDREDVALAVLQALNQDPPTPLCQVTAQFGYRTNHRFRKLEPVLCARLIAQERIAVQRASAKPTQRARRTSADEVRQALEAGLAEKTPTSVQAVASSLGLKHTSRLYRRFPDLCRAISAKHPRSRRTTPPGLEVALQSALTENPPPSVQEIARRFGFCQARSVLLRFPELAQSLDDRGVPRPPRPKTVAPVPPRVEGILRAALLEEPPPPLKAVAARVTQHKTFLRKTFPELWRSIRARFVQRKKVAESERREFLYRAVRAVVAELSVLGVRPTPFSASGK